MLASWQGIFRDRCKDKLKLARAVAFPYVFESWAYTRLTLSMILIIRHSDYISIISRHLSIFRVLMIELLHHCLINDSALIPSSYNGISSLLFLLEVDLWEFSVINVTILFSNILLILIDIRTPSNSIILLRKFY